VSSILADFCGERAFASEFVCRLLETPTLPSKGRVRRLRAARAEIDTVLVVVVDDFFCGEPLIQHVLSRLNTRLNTLRRCSEGLTYASLLDDTR
jgi:hypothetical protein